MLKAFFIYFTKFFVLRFLRISITLFLRVIYFFPLKPSILIIVVLNSRSDNASFPAVSDSGSDPPFVSLNGVILYFSMPRNCFLLLKSGHNALAKRNCSKYDFSSAAVRCGRGEEFSSPMIMSQSFSDLYLWTVNFTNVFQFFLLP